MYHFLKEFFFGKNHRVPIKPWIISSEVTLKTQKTVFFYKKNIVREIFWSEDFSELFQFF